MADDPPPSPKPKKRARRQASSGRSAEPKEPIATTELAEEFAEGLRVELVDMIDAAALMRAKRRRATGIDRVDYEVAFDDIVNPVPRPKRVALLGDVCGIIGAGFVGYSINIYTGSGTVAQIGHVAMLAGAILSVAGVLLKYVDTSQ
jgi:hypothetical protein